MATRSIMSNIEWRSPGGTVIRVIILAILILTSVVFLFPFLFAFTGGLKTSTEIFKPGLHLFPADAHWHNYVEAWQRSNQPVFVFGSLLAQSRFGASNFAIESLNHPDTVNNFRGALMVEQSLADLTQPARMRAASTARDHAALDHAGKRAARVFAESVEHRGLVHAGNGAEGSARLRARGLAFQVIVGVLLKWDPRMAALL